MKTTRTNTFSTQIFTVSKKSLLSMIGLERERLENNPNSNTLKQLTALSIFEQIVNSMDNKVKLKVEGVRGNGKIRDFDFVNMGSAVEAIVKSHIHEGGKLYSKDFGGDYDMKFTSWFAEVKTSLSGSSKATASTDKNVTVLINQNGAFLIRRAEVLNYTDSRGKLPYKGECGRRLIELSAKMGF